MLRSCPGKEWENKASSGTVNTLKNKTKERQLLGHLTEYYKKLSFLRISNIAVKVSNTVKNGVAYIKQTVIKCSKIR